MNEHLSDQQIARIEALGAARTILLGGNSFAESLVGKRGSEASLVGSVGDLIETGHYILTGRSFVIGGPDESTGWLDVTHVWVKRDEDEKGDPDEKPIDEF